MERPRIVIVDDDFSYIAPLQSKFIYEFKDSADIEIITEREYFNICFQQMQKIDVLIIAESFYMAELNKHEITNIFVMTEEQDISIEGVPDNVYILFKYTSVKGIFMDIVGISNLTIPAKEGNNEPQIIVVTSANGGTGKTTVALGLAAALSDMYKKVLYMEASRMQTFQFFMQDPSPITNQMTYSRLSNPGRNIYSEIKSEIRKEKFNYLPPIKAALMSFGIDYDVYEMAAKSAKESGDFDFIVIDADDNFDEAKAKMMNVCDHVMVVLEETGRSIFSVNRLASNINNSKSDKYMYICNKYKKVKKDSKCKELYSFKVDEYIEFFEDYEDMDVEDFGRQDSIRKIAFLLI